MATHKLFLLEINYELLLEKLGSEMVNQFFFEENLFEISV